MNDLEVSSPKRHKSKHQSHSGGMGAFIPREALDGPRPSKQERQKMLEAKLDNMEHKFTALVDELSKYREAASELAQRNRDVKELKERVGVLEEMMVNKANSPKTKEEIKHRVNERKVALVLEEKVNEQDETIKAMKIDFGELMHVYDDIQDRLYDIDRTWKNNLIFSGIKLDHRGGLHENPDCLEAKIRQVLKNKLNIGREIVIMRCQRIFNGIDNKGNKPIVVNFQKWSDKEEILRKSKILKNSGIAVEEDFSRTAKVRRRELEKLIKEIKGIDPERKCYFKYDKLVIDDDVFIYNDVERRIEKLPYTIANGSSHLSSNDDNNSNGGTEDLPSATIGRHRPKTSGSRLTSNHLSSNKPWRAKSVECIVSRIPEVSNSVGGAVAVMKSLAASTSSPSIHLAAAKEKARASAQEKMTPNFALEKEEAAQMEAKAEEVDDDDEADFVDIDEDQDEEEAWDECVREVKRAKSVSKERRRQLLSVDTDDPGNMSAGGGVTDDDDEEFLPLNNIVDWDEWNATGTYRQTNVKSAKSVKSRPNSPKLKANNKQKKTSKGGGNNGNKGSKLKTNPAHFTSNNNT